MAKKPLVCNTWMGNFRDECSDAPKRETVPDDAPYKKRPRVEQEGEWPPKKVPRKYKKGGKVRGCGLAKRGVRKAKMY
jgi:hypothetical protein